MIGISKSTFERHTKIKHQIPIIMTQVAIQEQLDAIKKVTDKALKSKAASRDILIKAGIISAKSGQVRSKKAK